MEYLLWQLQNAFHVYRWVQTEVEEGFLSQDLNGGFDGLIAQW